MAARRLLSCWLGTVKNSFVSLDDVALWCQQFTPLTAADPPDGVMLDISGCAHLFGGEAGLQAQLTRRLPGLRTAIAATATAAWGLARYGDGVCEDISPLPLAALRLQERTIIRLRRVGVRRVGELARLPRAELTAGFGPEPALQLARALGHAPEVLRFITPPPEWREAEHYPEPIFAPAQLQAALARLSEKLCISLAQAQLGATTLVACFYRIDAQRPTIVLNFAMPCRDAFQLTKLLSEQLAQKIDPGFGIEAMTLEAPETEKLSPTQRGITREAPDFSAPLNTLLNRLGNERLWRATAHASHIPEYAARRVPVKLPPVPWSKPRHQRPVKLLRQPDAITAIAPVPDEPPVFFSWRGEGHRIAHATGPERIAREWWRHKPDITREEAEKIRDYYAVEDSSGARFWVFRAGVHGGGAPVRWYLHGFF